MAYTTLAIIHDLALDFQVNAIALSKEPNDMKDFVNELEEKQLSVHDFIETCKSNRWFVPSMNELYNYQSLDDPL